MEIFYQGDFVEMTVEMERSGHLVTVHQNKKAGHELSCYPDREVQIYWDEHFSILLVG